MEIFNKDYFGFSKTSNVSSMKSIWTNSLLSFLPSYPVNHGEKLSQNAPDLGKEITYSRKSKCFSNLKQQIPSALVISWMTDVAKCR